MGKIKARECQNVEYKRSWQDKYLEWICGFANAQGAEMYIWVDDDHKVVGLEPCTTYHIAVISLERNQVFGGSEISFTTLEEVENEEDLEVTDFNS